MKSIAIALVFLSAGWLRADVKTQEKSQVQFPGMLGHMMNLFGGKAMREGLIDTVAVKGNRKITINEQTGQIVDLDEQKVYDLDMKRKTYKVTTFDELRRQMEEAEQQAKKAEERRQPAQPDKSAQDPNAKQMQIDFDVKQTGATRDIDGFHCREVVLTATVHEKGKTLEQSGGMVMTTHEWLAPRIAAMKEIADFDRRYAEKLNGPSYAAMPSADQMAAVAGAYPMLTQAMGKMNAENVNMDGTAILTSMTAESVAGADQRQNQQQNAHKDDGQPAPGTLGSLFGGIGRRAARNKEQKQQQQQASAPGRTTVMTMNREVLKVATDVGASDVAIPSGFKQKN